jgi:hypothetical protein
LRTGSPVGQPAITGRPVFLLRLRKMTRGSILLAYFVALLFLNYNLHSNVKPNFHLNENRKLLQITQRKNIVKPYWETSATKKSSFQLAGHLKTYFIISTLEVFKYVAYISVDISLIMSWLNDTFRIRGRECMEFTRSSATCGSGSTSVFFGKVQPREQLNRLTSHIDASQVLFNISYSKIYCMLAARFN